MDTETVFTTLHLTKRDKTKKERNCIYFFIFHIISSFNQIEIKLKEHKLLLLLYIENAEK
jgi:hypothetical protein